MTVCVLDTDVVIGALDRLDAHHRRAARLIPRLVDDGASLHLSVINYAEVLVKPAESADTMRRAVDAITSLRIRLHAPDPAIGREAARLAGLDISLADAFALATAKALDAAIVSFDERVRCLARRIGLALA